MDKLMKFKQFVKNNPNLLKFVKNNEMTWQKFYEMYDIYGEDDNIWKTYTENVVEDVSSTTASFDFMNWIKNIDMDSLQENINSVKRVIGVLQDLGNNNNDNTSSNYKPRPLYKHFED